MTLTADVTDILRAIHLTNNQPQNTWKSNTNKLAKTMKQQENAMTEDDLDKLFGNGKAPSAKKKASKANHTLKASKNDKKTTKVKT